MRPSHALTASFIVLGLLSGCAMSPETAAKTKAPPPYASATLRDAAGAERGSVDIYYAQGKVIATVIARELNPGSYGMHLHDVGQCEGPAFASAGPHWNPDGRQHGRDNPAGAHGGDLPNMTIAAGEIGLQVFDVTNRPIDGPGGLFDDNGVALVIHAAPDDMKTDPTGNSGARILCGVITRTAP